MICLKNFRKKGGEDMNFEGRTCRFSASQNKGTPVNLESNDFY